MSITQTRQTAVEKAEYALQQFYWSQAMQNKEDYFISANIDGSSVTLRDTSTGFMIANDAIPAMTYAMMSELHSLQQYRAFEGSKRYTEVLNFWLSK